MNYRSTRNSGLSVTSAEAIARGISADGGLFVPESIPSFSKDSLAGFYVIRGFSPSAEG